MKRYNIHLDPAWVKALDELRKAIIKEGGKYHSLSDLTRADLIRVALRSFFDLGPEYVHYYGDDLEKIIKKVIKKERALRDTHPR